MAFLCDGWSLRSDTKHSVLCKSPSPSHSLRRPGHPSCPKHPRAPQEAQGRWPPLLARPHPQWPVEGPGSATRRARSWGNQTNGLQSIHHGRRCTTLCSQVMREAHLPEPCDLSWQQWASSVGVAQWASSQPARGSAEKEGRWQGLLRAPGNHAGSPQVCLVCALPIQMSPWWLPAQCLNTTCPSPCPYACHKQ